MTLCSTNVVMAFAPPFLRGILLPLLLRLRSRSFSSTALFLPETNFAEARACVLVIRVGTPPDWGEATARPPIVDKLLVRCKQAAVEWPPIP